MAFKKNILPELTDTIINGDLSFYESSEELLNIFKDVSLDVVKFFIELDETRSSNNVLRDLSKKYIDLNNKKLLVNNTELPNNFKLYLNEKFQNLFHLFKTIIIKNLNDKEKSIFSTYSDDIGMSVEINHNLGLNNTPIFDTFYNLEDSGAPAAIPSIMYNKVSKSLLTNMKKMTLKNDALLKTNLRNIAGYGIENISETSHGNNLVYDNFDKKSRDEITNIKTEKIFETFGENLGDLISFYKNLNIREQPGNKSFMVSYQNNIEEVKNALDLFNNSTYSTTIINRIPLQGEFKPHNMYDPVTGEVYFASSQTLHRKYSALGYTHINPNINIESANPLPVQTGTELPQSDSSFSGGTGSGSSGGDSGSGGGGYGGGY